MLSQEFKRDRVTLTTWYDRACAAEIWLPVQLCCLTPFWDHDLIWRPSEANCVSVLQRRNKKKHLATAKVRVQPPVKLQNQYGIEIHEKTQPSQTWVVETEWGLSRWGNLTNFLLHREALLRLRGRVLCGLRGSAEFLMRNMLTSRLTWKRQLLCVSARWSELWGFVYKFFAVVL